MKISKIKYRGYEIQPHAKGWCAIFFNGNTISTETGPALQAKKWIDKRIDFLWDKLLGAKIP